MIKSKNKVTALNIISTVVLQGLAFISGPIFSSALGTNNYGIAAVYLTWVQLASTVFSLQAGGTVAVARVNYPAEEQNKYQASVLGLASLAYFAFSIIALLCVIMASHWTSLNTVMVIMGLIHGWGMYCVTFMNLKLTYEFKADKNCILSIVVSVLTVTFSILLIKIFPMESNYWGRILGQTIVYGIIGILVFLIVFRQGKCIYNREYWRFALPIAIPTVFHLLANLVLGQSDKVMIQNMVGNSVAGIYALAGTFGLVLNTLYNALNNSWVPFYYEYTKNDEIEEIKKHSKNYMELFTVLTIGFIFLSKEVFHLYADPEFWEGTNYIPLFSLGYFFVFLYSFPVNYEFYYKKTRVIALGTSGAAICNIVLNYILIHLFGGLGAVIATTISHGLQFLFHYFSANRLGNGAFPYKMRDFLPWLFLVISACIFYHFTEELWIIRWLMGALIGIIMLTKIYKRKEIF